MKKLSLLVLSIIFFGCATRKSQTQIGKEEKKEAITETVSENFTNTISTEVDYTSNEITETEIIEPIDNQKSFTVNGIVYSNTKLVKSKKKLLSNDKSKIKEVVANQKKIDKKAVISTTTKTKQKETQRSNSFWWWFLLLIPFGIVYYKYKKRLN